LSMPGGFVRGRDLGVGGNKWDDVVVRRARRGGQEHTVDMTKVPWRSAGAVTSYHFRVVCLAGDVREHYRFP